MNNSDLIGYKFTNSNKKLKNKDIFASQ